MLKWSLGCLWEAPRLAFVAFPLPPRAPPTCRTPTFPSFPSVPPLRGVRVRHSRGWFFRARTPRRPQQAPASRSLQSRRSHAVRGRRVRSFSRTPRGLEAAAPFGGRARARARSAVLGGPASKARLEQRSALPEQSVNAERCVDSGFQLRTCNRAARPHLGARVVSNGAARPRGSGSGRAGGRRPLRRGRRRQAESEREPWLWKCTQGGTENGANARKVCETRTSWLASWRFERARATRRAARGACGAVAAWAREDRGGDAAARRARSR